MIVIEHHIQKVTPRQFIGKRVELNILIAESVALFKSWRGLDFAGVIVYLKPLPTIDKIVAYLKVDGRRGFDRDGDITLLHPFVVMLNLLDLKLDYVILALYLPTHTAPKLII